MQGRSFCFVILFYFIGNMNLHLKNIIQKGRSRTHSTRIQQKNKGGKVQDARDMYPLTKESHNKSLNGENLSTPWFDIAGWIFNRWPSRWRAIILRYLAIH